LLPDFTPAFATALHVALSILRRHRGGKAGVLSPFVLPSFFFPVTPWLWPSPVDVGIAFGAHLLWFAICELVAPAPSRPPARSTSPPRRSSAAVQFATTSVLAVLDEASGIKTFRLLRPEGYEFAPGQFVPVRVRVDGRPHVRCYSLSSAPESRGYLEISVRRQGLVSTMLHETLRSGASVVIGRPAGTFVYPANDDRPIVLVAGGIGITPLLSMLRHAIASDPSRPVTLLYSARSENDLAFLSELRVIAERHPQVRIGITLTRALSQRNWRTGRIDRSMVQQFVAHPAHSIFCLCGPTTMIADTTMLLQSLGVPSSQIRSEHFDLAVAAAALGSPSTSTATEDVPEGVGDRIDADGCRVTFALSGRTATLSADRTLLELAESAGITIASSCRAGVCQACRTRVAKGRVDCQSDVLDPADREAGYVLPCVSWASSDCVLEA
jgi:ferredoxin-NADP reductase